MVMGNYDDKMRKLFNHSESAFSLVINLLHFVEKVLLLHYQNLLFSMRKKFE